MYVYIDKLNTKQLVNVSVTNIYHNHGYSDKSIVYPPYTILCTVAIRIMCYAMSWDTAAPRGESILT